MKLTAILALLASPLAIAAENKPHGHEHGQHATQGPNGGQVVKTQAGFSFEVAVDKDRKARIVFLDKDHKPVAPAAQSITGIAGERSAPVKLTFTKDKDAAVLISDKALPGGTHIPMILAIQTTPDAKAVTERFELHLH